ncbi:MAG: SUMF1/EgtB/PvdO family nonheme iron enzyme [Bacteroidetes bacterium]|nr:SUMF1/EgtB/PvdO family nonheme iron enzyme [Bacteroidota bacterium]
MITQHNQPGITGKNAAGNLCRNFLMGLCTALMLFVFAPQKIVANNIAIANITLTGQNTVSDFTLAQFDLSWENSWRTSTLESNWDAAWVFIKFRKKGAIYNWTHATLNTTGHTAPAGSTITTPTDGKGVFIYRSADGTGNVNFTGAQLRWNYGVDGIADADSVEICVFAIEMVYVPTGTFYLGDGTFTNIQGQFSRADNTTIPFTISSEGAQTLGGTVAANIGNNNRVGQQAAPYQDDFNNTTTVALAPGFPKGYNKFYCMKYEITHGQWVDFLNKITSPQEVNRTNNIALYRQNIAGVWPNHTTTVPYRALGYMSFADVAAYLDWAALRPMTEFEYEKSCRGTLPVLADEWASGKATTSQVAVTCAALTNDGLTNEVPANTNSNIRFNCTSATTSLRGPIRVGSFARVGTLTRDTTGASYYGIMELSGNVWETVVTVGNTDGRGYTGIHGNGGLTVDGYADATLWPTSLNTTWIPMGWGLRGGDAYNSAIYTRVSSRYHVGESGTNPTPTQTRPYNGSPSTFFQGGRGVRTAP